MILRLSLTTIFFAASKATFFTDFVVVAVIGIFDTFGALEIEEYFEVLEDFENNEDLAEREVIGILLSF